MVVTEGVIYSRNGLLQAWFALEWIPSEMVYNINLRIIMYGYSQK